MKKALSVLNVQKRRLSVKKEGTIQTPTDPTVIDLGLGQPSPSLLPTKTLAENFNNAIASSESSWKWLQYGAKQGSEKFRKSLANFLNQGGSYTSGLRSINENELFITSGASSSIAFVSQVSNNMSPS